jgi:hypothetical protein
MRTSRRVFLVSVGLLAALLFIPQSTPLGATATGYQTGFTAWRAANSGFADWTLAGVQLDAATRLELASAEGGTDPYGVGGYYGHNFYNGGSFVVGEATSVETVAAFGFTQAIASWNAGTPDGTWIETQLRVRIGDRWTKWYNLGVWASGTGTVERHSVSLQGDADGYVAVDTLVLAKKLVANAFQLKLRLFSVDPAVAVPVVTNASVAYSTTPPKKAGPTAGNAANWGTLLSVPECSQMVYPDGGNVWCSPTSTSMVLGFWGIDAGPCEPRVRSALAGVYDWLYDGHGNWPFNTAYAASRGMEAYVARFTGMDQVEDWVKAGVPVVISYAWSKNALTGAPVASSNGHLAVVVGFDASGNPIVNDPAAASNEDVQRTYLRAELEPLWLTASGGTVYLIYPPGWTVPDFPQ